MSNQEIIMFYIAILTSVFYGPYTTAVGLYKIEYGMSPSAGEKLKLSIPVYNSFFYEKLYTGGIPTIGISILLFIGLAILRFTTIRLFGASGITTTVYYLFLISTFVMYILHVIFIFRVLKQVDNIVFMKLLLFAFIPIFGQLYIGYSLPAKLKVKRGIM